jgi:hypothetical protein
MELAAQETLQETEARKLVAEVLGDASDSDSDEDLDDEEVLENVAATKEKVDYFVSLLQMAINAAPFREVNPLLSEAIFKTKRLMRRQEDAKKASRVFRDTSVAHYFKPISK